MPLRRQPEGPHYQRGGNGHQRVLTCCLIVQKHLSSLISTCARLVFALACMGACAGAQADGAVVTTTQVRAELLAQAPQGIAPGQPMWLGLRIQHQPHWHTYWKNPGDAGLPTSLQWKLPPGVSAGDIQWPAPKKLPIGPLLDYGYEGDLLLPVALTVPAGFNADKLDVSLHADWLVCKDVCIPESRGCAGLLSRPSVDDRYTPLATGSGLRRWPGNLIRSRFAASWRSPST